jgi:hypothetical protein
MSSQEAKVGASLADKMTRINQFLHDDLERKLANARKENARLRKSVKFLSEQRDYLSKQQHYSMPRETYSAVVKCLHEDTRSRMTPKQIDHALGLLMEWKKDGLKAKEK